LGRDTGGSRRVDSALFQEVASYSKTAKIRQDRNDELLISVNNLSITVQAIILQMNQEESQERDAREERHVGSQRDIRDIKHQLDRLSGAVGELVTAFKGNDMGTEGVLARLGKIEMDQRALQEQFSELKAAIDKKQMYLIAFFTTAGIVLGSIFKSVVDHFLKPKP
jgi:chromosome segregation ATPase